MSTTVLVRLRSDEPALAVSREGQVYRPIDLSPDWRRKWMRAHPGQRPQRQYPAFSHVFQAERGWYGVEPELATVLRGVSGLRNKYAFHVCDSVEGAHLADVQDPNPAEVRK